MGSTARSRGLARRGARPTDVSGFVACPTPDVAQTSPVSLADPRSSAAPAPLHADSRLAGLGPWAGRHRRALILALLVIVAASIALGRGVVGHLASGGFSVTEGEAIVAADRLLRDNREKIEGCRQAARKADQPVRCTVQVGVKR